MKSLFLRVSSSPSFRVAAHSLFAVIAVAVTTGMLLFLRNRLTVEVIGLLYLLPVMLAASRWGLIPSIVASISAFSVFNFFFLTPTLSFLVSNPEELFGLVVFMVVALLLSQAVSTANLHAAISKSRERDAILLYQLTQSLESQSGQEETYRSVARWLTEAFSLAGCEILLRQEDGTMQSRAHFFASSAHGNSPDYRQTNIPLFAHQTEVGSIRMFTGVEDSPPAETTIRLLTTFAAQMGLYAERMRLARDASRARLLEESDRMKSALLSSVSHDLRTPLAAIKASATVLSQKDAPLDPEARDDLVATIDEETDRLNRLVGDLLDQSRIEAGALRLKLDWCDLDELIRAAVRRYHTALAPFQVKMNWPEDLPLVRADYVQLDRVISNLLDNATRFAPAGTLIELSAFADADQVRFSITNAGPEIPARMHSHIFDKFYRISEGRSPKMGTGLGLSICKGIIEAHGGKIWVESPVRRDSGTRFLFTLPLQPVEKENSA